MDDPIYQVHSEELEITLEGSDETGWTMLGDINGRLGEVYSLNEAQIQAIEIAREDGRVADEDSPTVARWEDYVEGDYDNYREIKLILPDITPTFEHGGHFPDENLLAFLRVTDRWLKLPDTKANDQQREDLARLLPDQNVKTFVIDEFQSDWHQQGREHGYELPADEQDALRAERREIIRQYAERPGMTTEETNYIASQMSAPVAASDPNHPRFYAQKYIAENVPREVVERLREIDRQLADEVVPNAPFKGNAWITLGLKRAIVEAVENGYDALAWSDKGTIVNRYSERYETMYRTLYDEKMPSIVKKLTGQRAAHFDWDGRPFALNRRNQMIAEAGELERQITEIYKQHDDMGDLRAQAPDATDQDVEMAQEHVIDQLFVLARNYWSESGQAGTPIDLAARRRALQHIPEVERDRVQEMVARYDQLHSEAGNLYRRGEDQEAGYWIIPITDELREKVETEGFSLFQSGEGPRGKITFDAANKASIQLMRSADLSTFLHESGHLWLEMLGDLAEVPGADQRLTELYATTLKWLGVENRQAITTEHHEKFARGFEAYLREGRAPSPELQG
ncbi:MAG: hypothetical protein R3282_08825, partial [Rhodothermales bacterium]|nr:hypothetical protein [Rhodothermales bacterium]